MKKASSKSKAVFKGILDFIDETGIENLLPEVTVSLEKELEKKKGKDEIIVTSAVPMTSQQLKKIKATLEKKLKVKLPIVNKIAKNLVAGFTIRVNDWFVDSSISYDMESLKRSLLS